MTAARYWRLAAIEPYSYGSGLELSEVGLWEAGTRVDSGATLTASIAPASGTLADLGDSSNSGSVTWGASSVTAPGFYLQWDFGGTTRDINQVTLGSGTSSLAFPYAYRLLSSADAVTWTIVDAAYGLSYPGNNSTKTIALGAYPQATRLLSLAEATPQTIGAFDAGPILATSSSAVRVAIDTQDGGSGSITGTVKQKAFPTNTPLVRRVRLFHEASGRLIRETWSDTSGNYSFSNLAKSVPYTVVAYDYAGSYRAVIADNVQAT
jgi:hypothetical protein